MLRKPVNWLTGLSNRRIVISAAPIWTRKCWPKLSVRHDSLLKACQNAIREEWTRENETQIAEANTSLETLRRQAAEQKALTEELKKEYDTAQAGLDETTTMLAQQEKLAADVEQKVAARIAQAQKEAADFIANQAILHH